MSAAEPTLTARTFSGLRWTYLDSVASAAGQAIYVAVMSRLLDPTAFGLMAIANTATFFGLFLAQMGVANALIQRPTITDDHVRAGATSGLVLGALTGVAFALLAPAIAAVADEPAAVPLLRVMGLSFLLSGLQMTSQGLLRRDLRFQAIAVVGIVATLTGFATGIVMALAGAGVWSLVGAVLVHSVLRTTLYYAAARHSLRPMLRWEPYRALYGFGSRSTALRLMEVLGTNIHTFAIARYASTAALGLFSRAYYLVMLPIGPYFMEALSGVLFPGFSRIQQDSARLRNVYATTLLLTTLLLLPICAGMAVAGRELIVVVLGGQWLDAVPVVPWLALAGALGFLSRIAVMVCESRAALNTALAVEVGFILLLAACLLAATGGPLWGYAAAIAAAEALRHGAYLVVMTRTAGMRISDYVSAYLPSLAAAAWTALLIAGVRQVLLLAGAPAAVLLVAQILAGALAVALFIRLSPFSGVRRVIAERLEAAGIVKPGSRRANQLAALLVGPR